MIKEGDVVICVNEFRYDYFCKKWFEVGKKYKVLHASDINLYIEADTDLPDLEHYKQNRGVKFYLSKETGINYFTDYFATLAEWREQQIKSVIDE